MARTKEFERDEVLDRAMDLFWRQGYEATSLADLTEHLRIARQSLYDTFGDKRALYLAALDRYCERFGVRAGLELPTDVPVRRVIREALAVSIQSAVSSEGRGCMLVGAAAERCPRDEDVLRRFCGNTDALQRAFSRRLEVAVRNGELARHHSPRALARHFVNTILGIQISARAGTDREALDEIADVAVAVLG